MPSDQNRTLYSIANEEIRACFDAYLKLIEDTDGLSRLDVANLDSDRKRVIVLAGKGVTDFELSPDAIVAEFDRWRAVPFDLEIAITIGVYNNIRDVGRRYLREIEQETNGFRDISDEFVKNNPHYLPIFQHLSGIFSKAALKRHVGSVSDNSISGPAAQRLGNLIRERVDPANVNQGEILQRLESTLEGIVRDLIGRVLLESLVDSALRKESVPFKREEDYAAIRGVVYDFRADFVLPDGENPLAFIEVRKSSSRHASLYAKDKMFSAINWKGKISKLLAVLVVDGEWTGETLRVMADVFDYVVPISHVAALAKNLSAYLNGDETKLKWMIHFAITRVH